MCKTSYLLFFALITLIFFTSCSRKQYSNQQTTSKKNTEGIYTVVDNFAQFPGGEVEMMNWISSKIQYPKEAAQKGIEGRAMVRFVVDHSGNIKNPEIIQGVDASIDQEALRIVQAMPTWIPAEHNGKKVSMYYVFPLSFKLDKPLPREEITAPVN